MNRKTLVYSIDTQLIDNETDTYPKCQFHHILQYFLEVRFFIRIRFSII